MSKRRDDDRIARAKKPGDWRGHSYLAHTGHDDECPGVDEGSHGPQSIHSRVDFAASLARARVLARHFG